MAGTSLLALIDDIATTLDDVAVMTKVAAKKTAGVLGDDLALNAQQVSGVHADRELPVVWAVAKGSMVNKAILIPVALLISEFVPFLVTPLLMSGGLYLCFEGFEKVYEKFFHKPKSNPGKQSKLQNEPISESVMEPASETEPALEIGIFEREKNKGCRSHGLYFIRRNNSDHIRLRGHRPLIATDTCPCQHRLGDDRRGLWTCCWNSKD